jgi:hypothetical protein
MIAHNVNYMRELKTATLKEIAEASYPLLLTTEVSKRTVTVRIKVKVRMVVEIRGNHNVATENQHIAILIVINIDVRKL